MCAKFHFVDLAGSERAHKTGNVGDRFKGMLDFASQSKVFDVSSELIVVPLIFFCRGEAGLVVTSLYS